MRQADGTTFLHEYTIKDHLGNARVTYSDANNDGIIAVADIKQINHYYPFGLNMEGNWNGAAGSNKYQFNQKEWNDDFGLGLNDYGARFYDPAIARWTAVDPLGEMRANVTPYQYVQNNPVSRIDPTGMLDEKGADGTTNEQWLASTRQADGNQAGNIRDSRNQNRSDDFEKINQKRKNAKKRVELYYTNATSKTINELTAADVVKIVAEAGRIMKKNGINKNIRFINITEENARKYTMGSKGVGFVAIIAHGTKPYGLSNISPGNGAIGVQDQDGNFSSYINYGRIAREKDNFPNPIYGAGYSMAHEYLHQLLYFASTLLENNPYKFGHSNGEPNLNMDGNDIQYPIVRGSDYENITPAQKVYLEKYFNHIEKTGGF